ncbi:MAG: antibiotic biosynthesis monooxygenase family protein [Pseudomonadota bacterium]
MSAEFMHIGRFAVDAAHRDRFLEVMKDYEHFATQSGLDRSHLIEDEKAPGTFMHVTVWRTRDDWVAIEETPGHQNMHKERDALLAAPMEHDFVCGTVVS